MRKVEQAWQRPSQALSQQTPSTQKPELHSAGKEHGAPRDERTAPLEVLDAALLLDAEAELLADEDDAEEDAEEDAELLADCELLLIAELDAVSPLLVVGAPPSPPPLVEGSPP